MSELNKKLRYQTNSGATGTITLYTTASEAGSNYINLQIDGVNAYAALGNTSDSNASNIKVTKENTTHAVLTGKPSGKVTHITETFHWEYDGEASERLEKDCYYLVSEHYILNPDPDEGTLCVIAEPYKTLLYEENPDIRLVIPELSFDNKFTWVGGGNSYNTEDGPNFPNVEYNASKTYNADLYFLYEEE